MQGRTDILLSRLKNPIFISVFSPNHIKGDGIILSILTGTLIGSWRQVEVRWEGTAKSDKDEHGTLLRVEIPHHK